MSANAHLAVASSMYGDGHPLHDITEATGVGAAELADALAPADHTDQGPAPAAILAVPVTPRPLPQPGTAPVPAPAMAPVLAAAEFTGDQEALLAWAEAHESRTIQALAARTRSGLADLARRRSSELAAEQAASEVEDLKKQLAAAEARLRQAKTGRAPVPAPAPAAKPSRANASAGLPTETRAQIRTWARAHGHEVSDHGVIAASVMTAWANRDQQLAQAG